MDWTVRPSRTLAVFLAFGSPGGFGIFVCALWPWLFFAGTYYCIAGSVMAPLVAYGVWRGWTVEATFLQRRVEIRNWLRNYTVELDPSCTFKLEGLDISRGVHATVVQVITPERKIKILATGSLRGPDQIRMHKKLFSMSGASGCRVQVPPTWKSAF
ncbi:hypothetical protein ACIB24_05755 [Spongisporangium articulatum]|uniref:DUF304 domain-containing protein n=1 Tax=Spongisporangium articulatum TaxID=3362603 RepID=A0ABW8AKA1_9ACTN